VVEIGQKDQTAALETRRRCLPALEEGTKDNVRAGTWILWISCMRRIGEKGVTLLITCPFAARDQLRDIRD
jgi:hypothetical protein